MNRITINDHHDDIPKKNHAHQINDPKKYHVLKAYNFDLVQIILIIMTLLIRTTQYYIYDYLGQIIGSLWFPCLTWSCAKQTSALSESKWSKIHYDHLGQIIWLPMIIMINCPSQKMIFMTICWRNIIIIWARSSRSQ